MGLKWITANVKVLEYVPGWYLHTDSQKGRIFLEILSFFFTLLSCCLFAASLGESETWAWQPSMLGVGSESSAWFFQHKEAMVKVMLVIAPTESDYILYTEPETDTTIHVYTYMLHICIYIHTHHKSCFTASWWKGLTSNDQYIFWSISASEVVQTFHDELQLIILQGATGRWIKREWRNEARAGKNTHMRHHMQRTNKWQIRCVCLNFSLGNKHQVSSFCLGLDSVHKTQCNTGSTVTTSIHKWFFKKQLDLEMVLSTTPWDAMDHSAFFSPQKSGKENDQRDANRGDAKDIKKRLVSKASLGDRVRAEQNRLVPSSPEALPCTSEILPPQHLWTPNFFTSPDGEVGTGNLQKSELYGIMTYGFFFIALTCFHHKWHRPSKSESATWKEKGKCTDHGWCIVR